MHEDTIRALEFDRIAEAVRSFALTPLGAERLAGLRPEADLHSARAALAATTECVAYLEAHGSLGLQAPADIERMLTALAIAGAPLEAAQLRGLASFLESVAGVRRAVEAAGGGPWPRLGALLADCRSFADEIADIRARIDTDGGVVDDASPELRSLRESLRSQTARLRRTLDSYLRGRNTARYLQDQVVMERAGRCVLVVKTAHRSAIPGIVHDSSGSGASVFLEPLSTVEVNNDLVALREREAAEVRRILLELTDSLRRRAADLQLVLDAAAGVDALQARASFSRLCDGCAPELVETPHVELPAARHPLLIPAVRRRLGGGAAQAGEPPVPVDVRIVPPLSALVITGPNTGGKTVALKTAGLLALMAQAGLHIPAAPGARLTAFRSVFADIGDEQSITASVSTFSGHIRNVVAMERQLQLPALVLLDEVGAGSDPLEGGALGAEIVDHFRRRGALVAATTHDDTLKTYAATTEGVTCAGFGFDADSYAPNYRLTYGTPGRSLALEIAARLGVPPAVIDAARQRCSRRAAGGAAAGAADGVAAARPSAPAPAPPPAARPQPPRRPTLRVGASVSVAGMGLRGQLLALYQGEAEVDVRSKRLRVPLDDLREAADGRRPAPAASRVTTTVSPASALPTELNVIGCSADEALARAERYLDQAVLHEQRQVRIIHGRGAGVLQRSIAGMLAAHPHVGRFAPAERGRGGDGVTVIELKD